ncbi:hypothetical protein HA466_0215470 [Hirschfeldia incana]|nr:hypothetical protein HA466_0215470 [Hirschfeldia incana]
MSQGLNFLHIYVIFSTESPVDGISRHLSRWTDEDTRRFIKAEDYNACFFQKCRLKTIQYLKPSRRDQLTLKPSQRSVGTWWAWSYG